MGIDTFLIHNNENIQAALRKIDENQKGFLVVVDDMGHLYGTLTDGDIRRGLLKEQAMENFSSRKVMDYCCRSCISISFTEDFSEIIDLFKNSAIKFLPIIDEHDVVINVITKANMHGILLQNILADLTYDFAGMDENLLDYELYKRPWGFYKTTIINSFYQSKIIQVKPGQSLSLQKHLYREEHWIVVNGQGIVQIGESRIPVQGGSCLFIPKDCKHRMENTSETENLIVIEVQLGQYFGEDDIIRLEDNYGRV